MTPKREILEEVLEETTIATMAAIRGTTSQTHFAPKPIFFLNSLSITHHKLNKSV
jgi:hypothetical protein